MDYLQKKSIRSVAAAIAGFLRHCVRKIGITREKLPSCIALAVCPLVTFYLFEMYTHNPFTTMHFKTQILNMAFYVLTALLLFGIVKYVRVALMLQTAFFMAAGLANYYVLNFRSAPIMPWDIYSIGTAASVAGNFNYTLKGSTVLVIIGFLILLLIESRFHMKAPARVAKRAALILLSIVLIYGYTGMIQSESFVRSFGLYDKLFTPTVMNKRDGNIVAFLMELEYMDVEKPSEYSPEETGSKYTQAGQDSAGLTAAVEDPESVKRPNIIVIMDEAFSDLAVRGDFTTNEDYMPFIHRLQQGAENTRTGYLNVSVLGGNTANTEFEFLTGNTIGFLPQGSVAYQQYVQKETPSLASYLKELDYHTVAIHPYYASGWDRDRVYPLLGFDEFLSQDDFTNPKRIRNYISDESSFAKIIELYENKKEGEPLFVFNVTMQNHSGYEEEFHNFTPDITVDGIDSKALSMYLSLVKQTDSALQGLIDYFSQADEDTMIVFFGDHQPTTYVSNPILRNNKVNPETLTDEENLLKYKVPYVIWSNFDIEEQTDGETSANYLAMDVLENCDLPLPALQSSLTGLRKEYPVISAAGVREADGTLTTVKQCGEALNDYRSLEYYLLFDYER